MSTVEDEICRHSRDGTIRSQAMGWCSNAPLIIKHMRRSSLNKKIWPRQLCVSTLRGLREQLINDNKMSINGFGTACEEKSYEEETMTLSILKHSQIKFPASH